MLILAMMATMVITLLPTVAMLLMVIFITMMVLAVMPNLLMVWAILAWRWQRWQ